MGSNDNNVVENKPLHIVMLPWLAMGHILPYFELAKILASNGHTITFINSPKNIDLIPKPPKTSQPFINLIKLPLPCIQHLPPGAENTMDIPSNMSRYLQLAYQGLENDVTEVLKTSKPDWVFYDFSSCWLAPIAKSLNIASAHYNLTPAWSKCFFDPPKDQIRPDYKLVDMCCPPKWVPFQTTIHLKRYEIIRAYKALRDESGAMPSFDLKKAYSSCDLFLLRTSRELEGEWLDYISGQYKVPVVPVGLLPPSMQIRDAEEEESNPEWVKIKEWLDSRELSSVVYIGFGSELKLSQQDLTELAHGIELSGLPFFWALKTQKEGNLELPEGFEDRTKERGIVWKTWAPLLGTKYPQVKILAHGAIDGCMSHCGCSSVIEMIHYGHVLVTLPYLLDQCLFSRALEEKEVAMAVPRSEEDGSFTREAVAHTLRLAIVDEEGSGLRNNAKEMGKIFSSKDLHDQYIDDLIAALYKYRVASNTKD
ncbi:soyasaponin III rhamnosyltransferase-like [Vicia villosa]|uniref:soyasaponin III rhamnosyltransferase-like n=1 Tax=Vicia villosa TaxID=3911 RepID=UPI00273AFB82|nr:soyasaponin III rhamnosyltransferase-like [Vicia villosa]